MNKKRYARKSPSGVHLYIAEYSLWAMFGLLLGCANWHPWDSWQWWALFFALMVGVYARDWAMRHNE